MAKTRKQKEDEIMKAFEKDVRKILRSDKRYEELWKKQCSDPVRQFSFAQNCINHWADGNLEWYLNDLMENSDDFWN